MTRLSDHCWKVTRLWPLMRTSAGVWWLRASPARPISFVVHYYRNINTAYYAILGPRVAYTWITRSARTFVAHHLSGVFGRQQRGRVDVSTVPCLMTLPTLPPGGAVRIQIFMKRRSRGESRPLSLESTNGLQKKMFMKEKCLCFLIPELFADTFYLSLSMYLYSSNNLVLSVPTEVGRYCRWHKSGSVRFCA